MSNLKTLLFKRATFQFRILKLQLVCSAAENLKQKPFGVHSEIGLTRMTVIDYRITDDPMAFPVIS